MLFTHYIVLLSHCCAFRVFALFISDFALINVFLVSMIRNDLFTLGVILTFEFQVMQLSQNVSIWRVKCIGAASIRTLLIVLQSGNAFFTIKHCTCWRGALQRLDYYPSANYALEHLKEPFLVHSARRFKQIGVEEHQVLRVVFIVLLLLNHCYI